MFLLYINVPSLSILVLLCFLLSFLVFLSCLVIVLLLFARQRHDIVDWFHKGTPLVWNALPLTRMDTQNVSSICL